MKADDAKSPLVRQDLRNWFDNTLLSRLNDKATGRIVSIRQRLGVEVRRRGRDQAEPSQQIAIACVVGDSAKQTSRSRDSSAAC